MGNGIFKGAKRCQNAKKNCAKLAKMIWPKNEKWASKNRHFGQKGVKYGKYDFLVSKLVDNLEIFIKSCFERKFQEFEKNQKQNDQIYGDNFLMSFKVLATA